MNQLVTAATSRPPIVSFRAKAQKISLDHLEHFDLTQAVPNFPTPQAIREFISKELNP